MEAIPRVLHQIWLGPAVLPEREAGWCDRWRAFHPAWDVRLWQGEGPGVLGCAGEVFQTAFPAILSKIRRPEVQSEILRLELLLRYGGVYADCDCEPLKPIDELLNRSAFASVYWNASSVACCAFFGATAGHPWISDCVAAIPSLDSSRRWVFGSSLLGRMRARRSDVDLLAREQVRHDRNPGGVHPETLVLHRFTTNGAPAPA